MSPPPRCRARACAAVAKVRGAAALRAGGSDRGGELSTAALERGGAVGAQATRRGTCAAAGAPQLRKSA
eukprot:scaffold7044_cov215-Prasinococcus_capsulatus_cf.AAC.1